jgi:hypothetical protein
MCGDNTCIHNTKKCALVSVVMTMGELPNALACHRPNSAQYGLPAPQNSFPDSKWSFYRVTLRTPKTKALSVNPLFRAVPWLRRLIAGLPTRKPGFDPGSVHVGFVVDKVALGQVFPRILRVSPVSFIPPVLHYLEKWKKLIIFLFIFITGLHNKPQGCGASVASDAGPFSPTPPKKVFSTLCS